ncbi:aldehyde dehydrogenase family protein [Oceanobacillus sp. CF4.6]
MEKRPTRVIVAIVPWNIPNVLTMMKLDPSLVIGNIVVLKHPLRYR